MQATADIERPPTEKDAEKQQMLKRFITASLIAHVGIIALFYVKAVFFPGKPTEYLPSLRVDLVGLPDLKKNAVVQPLPKEEKPEEKAAEEKPKEAKLEAKPTDDKGDISVGKKKASKKEKAAQKKLKEALARIKAIERIKAMTGDTLKGNQISKGSALSGEAKASLETTYFDVVLERVRSYWELPRYLQEQNLSAKVLVFIDSKGKMTRYQFIKASGNDQFDSEVKHTLENSSPFPLPPDAIISDISGNGVLLGFPI